MALFSNLSHDRYRRRRVVRVFAFESLEFRNMPAVLVDVGHHFVEPDMSGQTISLSVVSSDALDAAVAGFDLRTQIVTAKHGPYFEGVRFAGDLWNSFPHVESGSPFPKDPTLASGEVAFTHGYEARADGTLVTLTIDTTGIPAGSYEFRLIGTKLGSSSFRQADGSSVSEVITNGTLQVRSIWQNQDNPSDASGDGRVTPLDVLLILNELSKKGSHELPMPSPGDEPAPFYDVNGDGFLSPLDPLGAINCLNGLGCATSPEPILARVTPGFVPGYPDSTGVGEGPDDPKTEEDPTPKVDPVDPLDCVDYELDEDGNRVPVIDPDSCEAIIVTSLPISPSGSGVIEPKDYAAIEEAQALTDKGLPAMMTAPALSPRYVDAAIFDLAKRLVDSESSDELVDLGL